MKDCPDCQKTESLLDKATAVIREGQAVYVEQVIPLLQRVLESEKARVEELRKKRDES